MILVPVKNSANAKQRLSPALDAGQRQELARAMITDVLTALGNWEGRPAVGVVTSDEFASALAEKFGFEVIADEANPGETGAIETATAVCEARGVEWTLVIPGDIPTVEAWELERVLASAPRLGTLLVPAGDGRGTNAAFRRPGGLFALRFGNDSFKPHLAAARATGEECTVLEPTPGLALDVDNPEDLWALANAPGDRLSQRLVRGLGEIRS